MKIEFIGTIGTEGDAYIAACRRILRWGSEGTQATVYVHPRDIHGWLEWHLHIHNAEGERQIVIAMIQRNTEAEMEFHS